MSKSVWCVVIAGAAMLLSQVVALAAEPAQTAPAAPVAPKAQPATEAAPAATPGTAPAPATTTAETAADDIPPKEELSKLNVPKVEWYDRIKTMARTTMLNASAKDYLEAEKKVLEINDPNALEPMALALYTRDTRWRGTFLKATKQYAQSKNQTVAPLAVTYLSDIAVLDPNPILRGQARSALIQTETPRYPERIQHHLKTSTDSAVRNRAAGLLADLRVQAGISDLIGKLVTEEWKAVSQEIESRHVALDIRFSQAGTPDLSRTATITAGGLVPATAEVVLPTVRQTTINTSVSAPAGFSVNTVWEKVEMRHPEILASLKRLTGKDFGYDQGAWARWLTEQRAASKSKEATPTGSGPDSIQWGR
jgi:hypothetical protein